MTTQPTRSVRRPRQSDPGPARDRSTRLLLFGLSLGYFMVLLDTTVVTVALPAIGHGLSGGLTSLQWVSNGYTLTFAALLLTAGVVSDRIGGRRAFLIGLWTFALISGLSAAATSTALLIALRALLGMAGAMLLPTSLALVARTFAEPAARARALGAWASISGAALAGGPVVGGLLTDTLGWRSIFLVNLPVALTSIVIVTRHAPETVRVTGVGIDVTGQVAAIAALAGLTYGLIQGGAVGWTAPPVLGALTVCVAAGVLFVLAERRPGGSRRAPMLPLPMFGNRAFSAGLLSGLLVNVGLSGVLFVLSLSFQQVRGYSALATGVAFLPLTLPTVFNPVFTGRLVARIGPRVPALVGFVVMAMATGVQASFIGGSTVAVVATAVGSFLLGCGVSLAVPSLIVAVVGSVPPERVGIGAGALNSARQAGAVLGVAVLGSVFGASPSTAGGTRAALVVAAALLLAGAVVSGLFLDRTDRADRA